MLGLPGSIRACLFDLDGVLTPTASVHAAAWKETFDHFLASQAGGGSYVPFDEVSDYDVYVDGKRRDDGTRSFLESRGVHLPPGGPDDEAGALTIIGIGKQKNEAFLRLLSEGGVEPFPGSLRYVTAAREAGLRRAVVSSSSNAHQVLAACGMEELFEAVVDGIVAAREHLRGKPAPDLFLAGAGALGLVAAEAAVFEDALAGVEAGRSGSFGYVVGVDRVGQGEALRQHGADAVVSDLGDLLEKA